MLTAGQPPGDGHSHIITLGFDIGPMMLRIALLTAVPVVAAFAMLRGFLGAPDRRTASGVVLAAVVAVVVELLLSRGLELPAQAVPLLLAGLAAPLYLVRSTDPRFVPLVARSRRLAPWVCGLLGAAALGWFARAAFTAGRPVAAVQTGVVLALVALSWFVVSRPRHGVVTVVLRVGAGCLSTLVLAGAALTTINS